MNLLCLLVLAAAPQAAPSVPESVAADEVPNYRVLEPGLAAAGQPTPDALRKLKALGFKTVINLRAAGEAPIVAEEKTIVEEQGLRYVSVPVTTGTFSPADVERVRKVLDEPGAGPVLLHCASSNRVGAVWGVIARQRGRSLVEAEAEAKRGGVTSPAVLDAFRKVAAEAAPPQQQ